MTSPTVLSEEELASCMAVHDAAEKERLEDYEIYGDQRHQTVEARAHYHRGRLLATIQAEREKLALADQALKDTCARERALASERNTANKARMEEWDRRVTAEKENAVLKAMVGELIQELRDREMGTSFKGRDLEIEDRRHCGICRKNWPVAEPEQHAPDCLLVTMPARLAEIDGAPKVG